MLRDLFARRNACANFRADGTPPSAFHGDDTAASRWIRHLQAAFENPSTLAVHDLFQAIGHCAAVLVLHAQHP